MHARGHLTILSAATIAWMAFWIAGLPSYYQQYSRTFMLWFDALALVPLAAAFLHVLRRVPPERRTTRALWMAFYFTMPLAVYDWVYCGLYLGHGLQFMSRYWYLSVYYVLPWLMLPGMAEALNRRDARRRVDAAPSAAGDNR